MKRKRKPTKAVWLLVLDDFDVIKTANPNTRAVARERVAVLNSLPSSFDSRRWRVVRAVVPK